jgi:hypothetical protein
MTGGNIDINMSSTDPKNALERSKTPPSVPPSLHPMTGGAHHNMVGTYRDWILANAKVIYGSGQPYDVVYSSGSTHSSGQDVRTAYFVAWHATDKKATLLLTNKGPWEIFMVR